MSPLTEQILAAKRQRRQALARLPFPEKVRIVEQLRDASKRMAEAGRIHRLREPAANQVILTQPC